MKYQDISGKLKCKSNWFEGILTWNVFWNTTGIVSTQNSFRMAEVFYGNKQDRMKLMSLVSNDTLPWRKRHQFKLMRQSPRIFLMMHVLRQVMHYVMLPICWLVLFPSVSMPLSGFSLFTNNEIFLVTRMTHVLRQVVYYVKCLWWR